MKCPFCRETIQNGARVCRWCNKDLPLMNFSLQSFLKKASFGLLLIAMFSFFLPFARFDFPMVGAQSFTAAGVLLELLRPPDQLVQKKADGRFSIDVRSLKGMMSADDGIQVFGSKPVYVLIPIGLFSGVIAWCLLIFIAIALCFKRWELTQILSVLSGCLVLPFWGAILLMDDILQTTIASSIGKLHNNPFAVLAGNFVQGMRIEPSWALCVLVLATFLLAVINWNRSQGKSDNI